VTIHHARAVSIQTHEKNIIHFYIDLLLYGWASWKKKKRDGKSGTQGLAPRKMKLLYYYINI
jgi:hypothetical protein